MADPLAIAVSISSIIAVGTDVLTQLYRFISSIRTATNNIQNLAREVRELCSILEKLEKNFSTGVRHQELWLDLKEVLQSCKVLFLKLKGIVTAYRIKRDDGWLLRQWKKGKWTFQEKEVIYLRSQLEAHKATLKITLLLSAHKETTSVKDTTDRIEEAVREVIDRLIQWGDGEGTASTYTSSFVLQRYLSSANSVFSSETSSSSDDGCSLKGIAEAEDTEQAKITAIIHHGRVKKKRDLETITPYEGNFPGRLRELQLQLGQFHAEAEKQRREEEDTELESCSGAYEGEGEGEGEEVENTNTQTIIDRERAKGKLDPETIIPYEENQPEELRKLQLQLEQVHAETDEQKYPPKDAELNSYKSRNGEKVGETEVELKAKIQAIIDQDGPRCEAINRRKRTYTKFSKTHLCKEALDEKNIAYTEKPEYFLVHRVVDKTEQKHLWTRTKEIRNYYKKVRDTPKKAPTVPGPQASCGKYIKIDGFIFVKQ